ncbi:hypothetical protein LCGC14_2209930 [marine sediment metagenome]|uniref:Transposase IS4-like domain-containing protein n=1 Tax=marine sediment metagenome TaxID=412755 RepID=A0A0F9DE17_9ZZZZ
MFKQTTLKKFVLPILLILTTQSNVLSSQADQDDFSRFILKISLKRTYPEAQSMKKGSKSADRFIKKSKKGNPRALENLVNNTLLESTSSITNELYPDGVKLAIDITKIPVYSKSKSKFISNGSAEKGTTRFYQFLGFSIAERQLKFPISFHLMEKGDLKVLYHILHETLSQIKRKLKISLIILDRGFISSKIVQTLYLFNYSFIIAFRRSKKITKACRLLENPKTMNKSQFFIPSLNKTIYRKNTNCWVIKDFEYGNPSVKVNLVIWKLKRKKGKSKRNPI